VPPLIGFAASPPMCPRGPGAACICAQPAASLARLLALHIASLVSLSLLGAARKCPAQTHTDTAVEPAVFISRFFSTSGGGVGEYLGPSDFASLRATVQRCDPCPPQLDGHSARGRRRCAIPGRPHRAGDSAVSPPISPPPPVGVSNAPFGNRARFRAEQRRGFRDYFTTHLPGNSLHPDPPPPKARKSVSPPPKPSRRDSAGVMADTRAGRARTAASRARTTGPRRPYVFPFGPRSTTSAPLGRAARVRRTRTTTRPVSSRYRHSRR